MREGALLILPNEEPLFNTEPKPTKRRTRRSQSTLPPVPKLCTLSQQGRRSMCSIERSFKDGSVALARREAAAILHKERKVTPSSPDATLTQLTALRAGEESRAGPNCG